MRNASDDALLYVCKSYFQSVRRWLRKKGVADADTPVLFSKILTDLVRDIQEKKLSGPVDFEVLLRDAIDRRLSLFKSERRQTGTESNVPPIVEVAGRCYNALDIDARRLLEGYHIEGLNYEQLAAKYGYGNASIAEFEVNRQMSKLEGLVHISLEE